jgi:hypothetical protein
VGRIKSIPVAAALLVIVVALGMWLRAPLPPPTVGGSRAITNDRMQKGGLVTDGSRIYFTETAPFNTQSRRSQAREERPAKSKCDRKSNIARCFPDQTELLVSQSTVWKGLSI